MFLTAFIACVLSANPLTQKCEALLDNLVAAQTKSQVKLYERELVQIGPKALPTLLSHLTDPRTTSWAWPADARYGVDIFTAYDPKNDEIDLSDLNFKRVSTSFKKNTKEGYSAKVGDLCMEAIGRIVDRDLEWEISGYLPFPDLIGIMSPVEDPALASLIRRDWGGITDRELVASYKRDCRFLVPKIDSVRQLVRFFPKDAVLEMKSIFNRKIVPNEFLPPLFEPPFKDGPVVTTSPEFRARYLSQIGNAVRNRIFPVRFIPFLFLAYLSSEENIRKVAAQGLLANIPNTAKILNGKCPYLDLSRRFVGVIDACSELKTKSLKKVMVRLFKRLFAAERRREGGQLPVGLMDSEAVACYRALGGGPAATPMRRYLLGRLKPGAPNAGETNYNIIRKTLAGQALPTDWWDRYPVD
jgi:hypothetical protein